MQRNVWCKPKHFGQCSVPANPHHVKLSTKHGVILHLVPSIPGAQKTLPSRTSRMLFGRSSRVTSAKPATEPKHYWMTHWLLQQINHPARSDLLKDRPREVWWCLIRNHGLMEDWLSLIHISEPTRLGM